MWIPMYTHTTAFHLNISAYMINMLYTPWYAYIMYYTLHVYKEFHCVALLSKYLADRFS